jgi:hypothetical protein
MPLELWNKDDKGYGRYHFGNDIVKLTPGVPKVDYAPLIEVVAEAPLKKIADVVPQTVEEVKTQIKEVNKVLDVVAEKPVTDVVLRSEVQKQAELGEDADSAVQRAVQVVKNGAAKTVKKAKEAVIIDVPSEVQEEVGLITKGFSELSQDIKLKPIQVKAQKILEKFNFDGRVVEKLMVELAEMKDSIKRNGTFSLEGFKARLKKVEAFGNRLDKAEAQESGPAAVGRKGLKNMNQEQLDEALGKEGGGVAKLQDDMDKLSPELQAAAMKAYNAFVDRASRGVEDMDVSLKGIQVMRQWWDKAGTHKIEELQMGFTKAFNNLKLEAQRTRARRGLIDSPGEAEAWQDISVDQGHKLLNDEEGPGGYLDAMKLRASENLEFYWNVPEYTVQANGQVKFGKLLSGKDGMVQLKSLETLSGFNGKQLKKGELEMWKMLVPDAFQGDKVDLNKLVTGLEKAEPVVKVVEYGQGGKEVTAQENELAALNHNWYDNLTGQQHSRLEDALEVASDYDGNVTPEVLATELRDSGWDETNIATAQRYAELSSAAEEGRSVDPNSPRATSYYNQISPFDTTKYPVQRIDVALPTSANNLKDGVKILGNSTDGYTVEVFGRPTGESFEMRSDAEEQYNSALWRQDDLHENLPNTLGWAMVQVVPDPRTGKNVMFVGEQQSRWGQTKQQQFKKVYQNWEYKLGQPVKNVFSPASEAGRKLIELHGPKVMEQVVDEKLLRSAITDDLLGVEVHPLLDIQHSLVLKAVIAEARKQGIDTLVISDGESAMMTEKHDSVIQAPYTVIDSQGSKVFSADTKERAEEYLRMVSRVSSGYSIIVERPKQEGGMRLHYDTTLPSEAKRLTQSEGEVVDLGVHKNTRETVNITETVPNEQATQRFQELEQLHPGAEVTRSGNAITGETTLRVRIPEGPPAGSPVFRNPDGTPKTSVTGRAYPLNNISFSSNFLFGDRGQRQFTATEAAEQALLLHGETPSNARVLTPAVVQVAEIFQQLTGKDIAIGTIRNGEGQVSGLARDNPLRREVFLDPATHPDYQGFVAAHEMLGHTFDYMHQAGMLDGPMSRHYTELKDGWVRASPEERYAMLRQLSDSVLPGKIKLKLDQLMEGTAASESESLANLQALLAYGFTSKQNILANSKFIPQPILSVMIDFGRWFRRMLNATKTAVGYRRLVGKVPGETLTLLHSYSKNFNSTLDALVRENNTQQRMMENVDMLTPGGYTRFRDAGSIDASLLKFEGNRALEFAADAMMLGDKVSNFVEPLLHKMERHPALRHLSNVFRGEQGTANALVRTNEVIMFGAGWKASGKPVIPKDGGNVGRVLRDSKTSTLVDDLLLDMQLKGYSFLALPDTDPARVAALQGLTDKQKGDVLSTLKRVEESNKLNQGAILDSNHRVAVSELAILLRGKLGGTNQEVSDVAKGLYETFRRGRATGSLTEFSNLSRKLGLDVVMLGEWMEPVVNAIALKKQLFDQKPYFVTERRMKQFHVRYDDKTGTLPGLRDFDTEEQAAAFVKEARANGWELIYPRTGYKDSFGRGHNMKKIRDQIDEAMVGAEKKTIFPVLDKLLASGKIDKKTHQELMKSREDFHSALSSENVEAMLGAINPNRKHRKGRENLMMLEQHMRYMHKLSRALPRVETNAELRFAKMDPAIVNDLESWQALEQAEKGLENFRNPDTAMGNKITKGMFHWFMGMNLSSALIEATQAPLSLSPKLYEEGASVSEAYTLPFAAANKIGKFNVTGKWESGRTVLKNGKNVDVYQALINRGEAEGLIGLGLQQEIRQMDYETMLDLGNMSVGNQARGKGALTTMVGQYGNLSSKLYGTFASFNEKLSFIAAFDLKHKQLFGDKKVLTSKEFEQLYQEAARIVTVSNSNAGRIGRPVEWFSTQGSWRTASQMMYALGSYNAGALSNLWRYVKHGMGKDIAGLTPEQQKRARGAGIMAFAHLISAAGVIGGIPFMGPLMALLDEHTDWEVEKNIREGAFKLGEEFAGKEGGTFVADTATHGIAYAMGMPIDISQRVAMNGILGFNSYEGWSAKALLGPVGSVGESLSNAASSMVKGDATAAMGEGLPPAFKRVWNMWANDGAVTDKRGKGVMQATQGEQAMMAMGFAPSRVTAFKEAQRLQFKSSRARQEENERVHKDIAKVAKTNPAQARQMLAKRAQENPGYSEAAGVDAVVDYLTRGKFGLSPNRAGNVQDAKSHMAILETFGNRFEGQMVDEVSMFGERTKARASLGQMPGDVQSGLLQALLVDQLVKTRGLTVPAARAVASGLTGGVDEQSLPLLDAFL